MLLLTAGVVTVGRNLAEDKLVLACDDGALVSI